jgi:pilus assembly protein CpaB
MDATLPQGGQTTQPREVVDPGKTRRRGWLFLLIAGMLAIAAGLAFFFYLARLEAEIGLRQMVVVAKEPIPARSLIEPEMLETVEIPVKYLPSSFILNPDDLLTGNTTALINIAPGEYIQQNMVSQNAGLEPERRAISIAVDSVTSVGNSVRQGNFVDIVISYVDENDRPRTEMLLQNVKVLAVDTLLPAQGGTGGQTYLPAGVEGDVELVPTTVVTLELSAEDAMKVAHAENFAAELRLLIRRLDETSEANVEPVEIIGGESGTPRDTVEAPDAEEVP